MFRMQTWLLSVFPLSPSFIYDITSLQGRRDCLFEDLQGYRIFFQFTSKYYCKIVLFSQRVRGQRLLRLLHQTLTVAFPKLCLCWKHKSCYCSRISAYNFPNAALKMEPRNIICVYFLELMQAVIIGQPYNSTVAHTSIDVLSTDIHSNLSGFLQQLDTY